MDARAGHDHDYGHANALHRNSTAQTPPDTVKQHAMSRVQDEHL